MEGGGAEEGDGWRDWGEGDIIVIIDHLRMQPDGYGAVIYIF